MLSSPRYELDETMRIFLPLGVCALLAGACAGGDESPASDSDGGSSDDTAGADSAGDAASDGADGTDGTSGSGHRVEAALADHPLVAWVTIQGETAGEVWLEAVADGAPRRVTPSFWVEAGEPVTVPFLGLRPETTYEITLVATDLEEAVSLTTGPLPDDLPPVTVEHIEPDRVNPGFIVFPLSRWDNGPVAGWGYAVALDEGGQVAWYTEIPLSSTFRWSDRGTMYLSDLTSDALEVDALGSRVNELDVPGTGLESIHHELDVVDDAGEPRLLFLSSELRQISGYPDDETGGTVTHNVVGDVVAEASWDGTVGRTVNLFEVLDPMRTTEDFDYPFWNIPPYAGVSDPKDWTHGNAILEDEDGDWLVSLRNQDWLVKLDPDAGTLLWRMGHEGDFSLLSGRWFSTQHSPSWLDDETLLLYDNGTHRPGETSPSTRVVAYRVDEEARTLDELWEYTGEVPYYAPASGDVDALDDGLLITDGGVVDAITLIDGVVIPHLSPRVVEVEGEAGSYAPVLSVTVGYWGDLSKPGYLAYRGDKVADLYGSGGVAAYAR